MNPDTGHLVEILNGTAPDGRPLKELLRDGYRELPEPFDIDAKNELAGKRETYVDLGRASPLSQWAADQRRRKEKKKQRNRRRRKETKR